LDGRLQEAISLALKELEPRSGDRVAIRESVTRLVVMVDRRNPELSVAKIKEIVVRMLTSSQDLVDAVPPEKARGRPTPKNGND
jgi:hypothetical protein